jgi:hypothetical protein
MDICIDSNILIYAFNAQSQFNAKAEAILEELIRADGFADVKLELGTFGTNVPHSKTIISQ